MQVKCQNLTPPSNQLGEGHLVVEPRFQSSSYHLPPTPPCLVAHCVCPCSTVYGKALQGAVLMIHMQISHKYIYALIGAPVGARGLPLQVSRFIQSLHHKGVCMVTYVYMQMSMIPLLMATQMQHTTANSDQYDVDTYCACIIQAFSMLVYAGSNEKLHYSFVYILAQHVLYTLVLSTIMSQIVMSFLWSFLLWEVSCLLYNLQLLT